MKAHLTASERAQAVDDFVALIRFPTISGSGPLDGSYDACGKWLLEQLVAIGLVAQILPESVPHKPVVVATWVGTDPSLPAILLNGHYDVVPVIPESWTVPAFDGVRQGTRIYGRGAQDMKCVCAQYLVALRHLKASGFQPLRTVHVSFVPDEEVGGADGMGRLLASDWYHGVTIDLALDEGLASEDDEWAVFYGERMPWWVKVTADGNTGHGSRFIEGTAVEQIMGVTQRALAFRQEQKDLLHGRVPIASAHVNCAHSVAAKNARSGKKNVLGDVTSLNVTMLRAGVQSGGKDVVNVVPAVAEAAFDIRISPHEEPARMKETLDLWCEEVTKATPGLPTGGGVKWQYYYEPLYQHHITSTDPAVNPWWGIVEQTLTGDCGVKINPSVFPAATDSRFLRALGVKALGFSPMRKSPILLHEHDEYLDDFVFLEGCDVFVTLIHKLASQGPLPAPAQHA
jgi:aminoacylase